MANEERGKKEGVKKGTADRSSIPRIYLILHGHAKLTTQKYEKRLGGLISIIITHADRYERELFIHEEYESPMPNGITAHSILRLRNESSLHVWGVTPVYN